MIMPHYSFIALPAGLLIGPISMGEYSTAHDRESTWETDNRLQGHPPTRASARTDYCPHESWRQLPLRRTQNKTIASIETNELWGVYTIQQTSSKCIQKTRANAGRLLDRVNTLLLVFCIVNLTHSLVTLMLQNQFTECMWNTQKWINLIAF